MICFLPTSLISPFQLLAFLLFLEQTHPFSTSGPLHLLFSLSRTLFLYCMNGNLFLILQDPVHISPPHGGLIDLFYIKGASTLITLSNLFFIVVVFYLFLSEHFTEYEFMLMFLYFFFLLTPNTLPSFHPTNQKIFHNVYTTWYFREVPKYPPFIKH